MAGPPSSGVASPAATGDKLGAGANTSAGGSSSKDLPKSSTDQQQLVGPGSSPAATTSSTASPSLPGVSVVPNKDNGNAHSHLLSNPTSRSTTAAPSKPGLLPSLMASEKNHLTSNPSARSPISTPLQSSRPASPSMGALHSKHSRSTSNTPQSPSHLSPTIGTEKTGLFKRTKQKLSSMTKGHGKSNSISSPMSPMTPSSPKSPVSARQPQPFPTPETPRDTQTIQAPQTPTSNHFRNSIGPGSPRDVDNGRERNWDPRATASSFRSYQHSGSLNDPKSSDIAPSASGPPDSSIDNFDSTSSLEYGSSRSPGNYRSRHDVPDEVLEKELGVIWILNLSMHYRETTHKEKFFVTYRFQDGTSRRLTVSVSYRGAEPNSLEDELRQMKFQKDKSALVYRAVRSSLPNVRFFETATNLRLETIKGALHINVAEDLNEVIPYPPISVVQPINCRLLKETDLEFESHLSGYVYKVKMDGKTYIKKEIPGPHTVDEFLYEINGLFSLRDSKNVIRFGGVVVDADETKILGLIIDFAAKGAMIDILYDYEKTIPWDVRERWAREIVEGLSEIHEAGYVQGDFTLSNIVVDDNDKAKIIDINRRGCPIGWEPPELKPMIQSYQRIAMYIGVKSDIFQMGMVLWGLMMQDDEPERPENKPLTCANAPSNIPEYFKLVIQACLSDDPQSRPSAKELLSWFPPVPTIVNVDPVSPTKYTFPTPADPSHSTPPPSQTYLPMNQQVPGAQNNQNNQNNLQILPISPNPSNSGGASSSGYIDGDRENQSDRFSDYVDITPAPSAASTYSVEGGFQAVSSGNNHRVDSGFCEDDGEVRGRARERFPKSKDVGPEYSSGGGIGLGVIMEKEKIPEEKNIVPVGGTGQAQKI